MTLIPISLAHIPYALVVFYFNGILKKGEVFQVVVNDIAVMQHRATVYPNGMHDIPKMLDKE